MGTGRWGRWSAGLVGFGLLLSGACKTQGRISVLKDADASQRYENPRDRELRVLLSQTPRDLKFEALYTPYGYEQFPNQVFARKGGPKTPEERIREKMQPNNSDSAAHRFLTDLGQQIYQQALLAPLTQDSTYADNALLLLNKIVAVNLGFKSDPLNSTEYNDNRMLEAAWFLTNVARGARILDRTLDAGWKQRRNWEQSKANLNAWIGFQVDQTRFVFTAQTDPEVIADTFEGARMIELASGPGLMNWVGVGDTVNGSTNRTFAALEAQFRVAEFRGGKLGSMKLQPTQWMQRDKLPLAHDGDIAQLFTSFRGYLKQYFLTPPGQNTGTFILGYDPKRTTKVGEWNAETCRDPLNLSFKAECLVNKDGYRNDSYHPQMGLASVMNILQIAKRRGYDLSPEEHTMVKKGLRWACFFNQPGIANKDTQGSFGIPVWELAFRFYGEAELGPYCKAILLKNRAEDQNVRASFAWGYDNLNGDL